MSGFPLVSNRQDALLRALATYRFLSYQHMQLLGLGTASNVKGLREALQPMVKKNWVGRTEKSSETTDDMRGGLEIIYWLKPAGAKVLSELPDPLSAMPVRTSPTLKEALKHRLAIIRTHILLRQWAASAGATVTAFRADYDAGPSRGTKATAIPYSEGNQARTYTPDAIATVTLADGHPRVLVIEVYQGGRGRRLDHFKAKLAELHTVADQEAVEVHEGNPARARFLVVFADTAMRATALGWWPDKADEVWAVFHIKSVDELAGNFAGGWWGPGREPGPLFAVGG